MISLRKRKKFMRLVIDNKFKNDYEKTSLYYICGKMNINHKEALHIATLLVSQGFLTYQPPLENVSKQDFVILTKKGISFFEDNLDKLLSSFKNGIILPIITTILTSLLIYLSRNLLIPILEWFLSLMNF